MGTRAQIDVRQGNKVIRIYSPCDSSPSNIQLAIQAAAGRRAALSIAQAIVKYWVDSGGGDMRIIDQDENADYLNYRYTVDVTSKPWRVRQTEMESIELPTNPDGSVDDSNEAFKDPKNRRPAVTTNYIL